MLEFLFVVGQLCTALAAIAALLSGTWVCIKKPWRVLTKTIDQVGVMSKALGENGGESLADDIRRQGVEQLAQGVTLRLTAAKVDAVSDLIERPVFQADARGHWVRVNRTFDLTFGYPSGDVLGMGWVDLIASEDRTRVMAAWGYSIADKRIFRAITQLVSRTNVPMKCSVVANPIVAGESINWLGTIEIIAMSPATP